MAVSARGRRPGGAGSTVRASTADEAPSRVPHTGEPVPDQASQWTGKPRPYEILAAGYFAVTGLLVLARGATLSAWWPILLLHAGLVVVLLAILPRIPGGG